MVRTLKFILYLLFSTIMFTLTANFVHIISPAGTESQTVFILTLITILIFSNINFKMYISLSSINSKNNISKGLLYSSLVGAILISILSISNYIYSNKHYGDIERENTLIYHTFLVLIGIIIINIIITTVIDGIINKRHSKYRILLGSVIFYLVSFLFSLASFFFFLAIVGGLS